MKTKLERIWQGMALLAAWCSVSSAQAAVSVYGIASSSGELITTRIYAHITTTPIVSYSFKVFYDSRLLRVAQATRNDGVWSLFDGVRPVVYQQPDASHRGEVWFLGAKLDARNPGAGVLGSSVLLGTVVFSRLGSETPDFRVTIGRPGEYANFVTSHGISLDALPGEVTFASVTPTRDDRDLDGLNDEWEVKFFEDPKFAFYSDDRDRDGINNLGEQALGSDPTDEKSNLRLRVFGQSKGVLLEWTSFADRTYTSRGVMTWRSSARSRAESRRRRLPTRLTCLPRTARPSTGFSLKPLRDVTCLPGWAAISQPARTLGRFGPF